MQVTYAEVAEQALGPVGKTIVEIQLVLSQTGFCVAYIVFIYSTLSPAVVPLSATSIVLLVLPLQVTSISLAPGLSHRRAVLSRPDPLGHCHATISVYCGHSWHAQSSPVAGARCAAALDLPTPLRGDVSSRAIHAVLIP